MSKRTVWIVRGRAGAREVNLLWVKDGAAYCYPVTGDTSDGKPICVSERSIYPTKEEAEKVARLYERE